MSEPIEFEISTTCSCVDETENGEFEPSQECYGCWDDLIEVWNWDIYKPWIEANNMTETTTVSAYYADMNWDRQSGGFKCQVKDLEELEPLKINSDFTLRFKLDGKTLTVVRSSHDEYAAKFTFEPLQAYCVDCKSQLSYALGLKPDWARSKCGLCVEAEEAANA